SSHGFREKHSHVTQSTKSDHCHLIPVLKTGMPHSTENSQTCAHQRRSLYEPDTFWNWSDISGWSQHVFLKPAIFCDAGKLQFFAKKFICSETLRTHST